MDVSEVIMAASLAWRLYEKLKKAAAAQGMSPEEFNLKVEEECQRVDKWLENSNAAEDAVFDEEEVIR